MKITDQTTFAELDVERQRLGVTYLLVSLKPSTLMRNAQNVEVSIISDDGILSGAGASIPEAIADSFAAREQQIAGLARH
jgi:hypothetical protein